MRQYLICTVPRSGSNLLAEGLSSTGVAGKPLEYFNPDYRGFFLERWHHPEITSESEFLELVFQAGTTSNGIFGAKLQWFHVPRLTGDSPRHGTSPEGIGRFLSHFPCAKYIFLTRSDKLRQAISWYRAGYKNTWWSIKGVTDARSRTREEPPFQYSSIKRCELLLRAHEHSWIRLFSAIGIRPLCIEYEQVCADLQATISSVLKFIEQGGETKVRVAQPRLRKQSDLLTEEWVHACVTIERQNRVYKAALYGPNYTFA